MWLSRALFIFSDIELCASPKRNFAVGAVATLAVKDSKQGADTLQLWIRCAGDAGVDLVNCIGSVRPDPVEDVSFLTDLGARLFCLAFL